MFRRPFGCVPLALTCALNAPFGAAADSAEEVTLAPVKVRAAATDEDGGAAQGYRSSTATQVGPLGELSLQDAPFSLNVIPAELIENVQASTPDDVFRLNPVVQLTAPQSRFFTGVTLRGFNVSSSKRIDGLPNANMISVDMEDKERIEVLTGLSGFLYGVGNVGGTLDYILKRPTYTRRNSVTVGDYGGDNFYVHGDFGGPLEADDRFAYRLNLARQNGDTEVDHQSIDKTFASGALDWNLTDHLLLQLDASHSDYRMEGTEPYWSAASAVGYPSAPAADRYYGQPYTYTDTTQAHLGARLHWTLNEHLSLRAAAAHRSTTADLAVVNNTFVADGGFYTVRTSAWEYPDIDDDGAYVFADARFATGALEHRITAGYYGDRDERTNYRISPTGWTQPGGVQNIDDPRYIDAPPAAPGGDKYTSQRTANHNFVLGDDIRWGRWSALLGVNRTRLVSRSYDAAGNAGSRYDESALTPSAALLYRLRPDLTLYLNYMEGLEQGGTAATTYGGYPVTNAGAVLDPLTSEQYEAGAKAQLGGSLLTLALFRIDKSLQYYDLTDPTRPRYVQSGRQVHTGIEFTTTGKVGRNLTLVGGVTALRAEVRENRQTPALEGKTPADVAELMAKLYAEYSLDAVPGATLTGGIYHTGRQSADQLNTDYLPAFTIADIGVRYATTLAARPLTLRLNVENLANARYWLNSTYLGARRTIAVSAQLQF